MGVPIFQNDSINPQNKKTIKKKRVITDKFINIIAILSIALTFLIGIPNCSNKYKSIIYSITAFVQKGGNITLCTTNIVFGLKYRQSISSILVLLGQVDSFLQKHFRDLNYKSSRRRVIITITVGIILNLLMITIDSFSFYRSFAIFLCNNTFVAAYSCGLIIECQVLIFLVELKHRFRYLNNYISSILNAAYKKMEKSDISLEINELINCRYTHAKLCEIGKLINTCFQFQITLKIFLAFLNLITAIFYMYIELNNDDFLSIQRRISYIYYIILEGANIFFITYGFTVARREVLIA